jgi:hypothetical protein
MFVYHKLLRPFAWSAAGSAAPREYFCGCLANKSLTRMDYSDL